MSIQPINKITKTITLCSGKGGVGKSVLTANLAKAITANGQKAIVFDSVNDLPNQQIIFGVEPPIRLSSVLSGKVDVDSAVFKVSENNYLLVDSPFELNDKNDFVFDFDYLFIDTASGISDKLIDFCISSDLIVLLITDEPTSLLDAYGLIKILINYIEPQKIVLLVNNVIDSEDAIEVSGKLNLATSKFLNISLDVLGFVPYSRNIRLSIQRQELLIDTYIDDESSIAIKNICELIKTKYFTSSYINKKQVYK
jgi:flagellar biosynthesis protein FlhG